MRFSNATRFTALASTLLCASAVAQTRFCMGGDLEHLSAAQKASCNAKLQAVKTATAALHAPDGWHFVLVCGENGWKDYAAYAVGSDEALADVAADTNLDQRETFFRSDRLDIQNNSSFQRAVAREVAGIVLHSHDEVAIANQVNLWKLKSSDTSGF